MLIATIVGVDIRLTMDLDTTLRNLLFTEDQISQTIQSICSVAWYRPMLGKPKFIPLFLIGICFESNRYLRANERGTRRTLFQNINTTFLVLENCAPQLCGEQLAYSKGSVTVAASKVTAVLANNRPLTEAPAPSAMLVPDNTTPSRWAEAPKMTPPPTCQKTFCGRAPPVRRTLMLAACVSDPSIWNIHTPEAGPCSVRSALMDTADVHE